jgi:hypothetical protein
MLTVVDDHSLDKERITRMGLQFKYIYLSIAVTLISVVGGFFSSHHAPVLVITVTSILMSLYLISELQRFSKGFETKLAKRKEKQQSLSILLATEINNMIRECEVSLDDINSTQTDAVDLISTNFVALQRLISQQHDLVIRNVRESSLEYVQISRLTQEIKSFMNESVRGVQFGDINGQNLQFCLNTLHFIREQIDTIGSEDLDIVIADIREYLDNIRKRRDNIINPVSSASMEAGEIEFF